MSNPRKLVQLPVAQRDPSGFAWQSAAIFVALALLSCWLTSQYVAWALHYALWAAPWDVFLWMFRDENIASGPVALAVFERAHLMLGAGAVLSVIVPLVAAYRRSRKRAGQRNDLHGSAHFADAQEVKATDLLPSQKNAGGVLFGAWQDNKGNIQYLRHKGPEHMLVFAPTRSGKGVGIVMPTLLCWSESVLVNDIKGELWELSSGFRERVLGQRCIRFSPATADSARFNPLDEIREDMNIIKDAQNIALMVVDPEGRGLEDHWAKTAFDLFVGILLYVRLSPAIQSKTLSGIASLLSDGGELAAEAEQEKQSRAAAGEVIDLARAVLMVIQRHAQGHLQDIERAGGEPSAVAAWHGWRAVREAVGAMLNKAPNEFSGVQSTAVTFLSLYRDPIVAANTAVSDFRITDLMGGGFAADGSALAGKASLYIVNPPNDKDRIKPLTRLVLTMVIKRLTEGMEFNDDGTSKSLLPHRLLLLIDEFPSLGKLPVFEEALAFIAGYGLKALLIVQDASQMYAAYTQYESIFSNCHIRVAYAPNKTDTAELLSKMTGLATVVAQQTSYSGNRLATMMHQVSTSDQIVQRPLLTPDECMRLPATDELVFVAGHAPIYCQKIVYYQDEQLLARMKLGAAASLGRDGQRP